MSNELGPDLRTSIPSIIQRTGIRERTRRLPGSVKLPVTIPTGVEAELEVNHIDSVRRLDIPASMEAQLAGRGYHPIPATMEPPHPMRVVPRVSEGRTFTGSDIKCVVHVYDSGISKPMVIANAQTLSYSVHREKVPVRALGHTYAVGITRGTRTLAGSIVFTMFDREILWDIVQAYAPDTDWNDDDMEYSSRSPLLDQLPPFDITITFANEYGDVANMAIYGVELVDEGVVLSVDDMLVEKTVSWVARDIDMIRPYHDAPAWQAFGRDVSNREVTQDDINAFLGTLKSRRDQINRTSPAGMDSVWRYDIPYDYALFADTATQDREYPVITAGASVVYNDNGLHWRGRAYPVAGSSITYEFKPDTATYPGSQLTSAVRVHTTYTDANGDPLGSNIPTQFTMDTRSSILVSRDTLQPQ